MDLVEVVLSGVLAFGQPMSNAPQQTVKYAGLQVLHDDGAVSLRLKEVSRETSAAEGATDTVVRYRDEAYPFEVTRRVRRWGDCGVVETWDEIRHGEGGPVRLLKADSFAAAIPVTNAPVRVLSLTGAWAHEANVSVSEVARGQSVLLTSRSGTQDAWESNAGMMVSFGADVTEETGRVLGVALEWTGTTARQVRRDWNGGRVEVFAGVDMTSGPYVLDPNVVFTTPRAVLVWSEEGRGAVSRAYHRWARNHLMPHGRELRPVLLNSWEGSYFSFTEKTLTDMMDGVREMGGELFVLDDGWFGRGKYARDDTNRDKTGLGDWYFNPEKLPRGLGYLSRAAQERGLKFGLWVEPEMANTLSHLVEAHPDWILREPNREPVLGRGGTQAVLDFTNPAVRADIWEKLDRAFSEAAPLAYVKWDCNAHLVNPGSTHLPRDRQSNLWIDYTRGVYDLLATCRAKRPETLIQACSSGGGHMDFGFLRYCDEFWASDCTDPLRRVFIQWGSSQFYPANAMACHVTASPNHQTKRETPLKYRFDVAMTGRFGFELHPKDLSADELAFAKAAVADYKRIRPVVQQGDLYRLASPYEKDYAALAYAAPSRDRAVAFALALDRAVTSSFALTFRGLDYDRRYRVSEINRGESLHATLPADAVSGRELMEKGVSVRLAGAYDSAVFEVEPADSDRTDVHDVFRNPPESARLQCWYHVLDNYLTEEGLAFDFKAMAEADISTAYLFFPLYLGDIYSGSAKVMSEEWLGYFASAIREAKRNGIALGFHNCPGWTSSGGPWITPENSMKCVVSAETFATADARGGLSLQLPEPPKRGGFYRDIAVYVFPSAPYREDCGAAPKTFRFRTKEAIALDDVFVEEEEPDGSWRRIGFYHCDYPNRTTDWRTVELKGAKAGARRRVRQARGEFESWLSYRPTEIVAQAYDRVDRIPDVQRFNSASERYGTWTPERPNAVGVDPETIADLTAHLKPDGRLEVPSSALRGDVLVVRIGFTTTGEGPHPTTAGGLECDKLDPKGVEAHWAAMPAKILALPGAKETVRYAVIDSYEVGGQNWTPILPAEFARRRGYPVGSNLLRVCGYLTGRADACAAFFADWQRTISELFAENYYGRFTDLCHAAGLKSVIEPYGGPFDPVACGLKADVPTAEFWADSETPHQSLPIVRRIAEHGRHRLIAAESFTSRHDRWQLTPHHLREWGDRFAWLNGVNQLVLHSYCHQPLADGMRPGFTMGVVGTQLNGNTLWWPEAKHWSAYVKRGQALLQYGRFGTAADGVAEPALPKGLRFLRREGEKPGERIYFLVNDSTAAFDGAVELPAPEGSAAEVFDAKSGQVWPFGGRLRLEPRESAFVVFTPRPSADAAEPPQDLRLVTDLSDDWTIVSFDGYQAPSAPRKMAKLASWSASDDPRLRYFSGRAVYERGLGSSEGLVLDLGDVREVANVWADGRFLGCLWERPYRVALPKGAKRLRVEVVNNWRNRVLGDALAGVTDGAEVTASNWKYDLRPTEEPIPSGLLGPVRLLSQ